MYFLQEKESLITELRKELRLSNEEHRELLGRVNADDVIRRIRSDKIVKQGFLLVYLCFRNEFVMTFHVCTVIMLLINACLIMTTGNGDRQVAISLVYLVLVKVFMIQFPVPQSLLLAKSRRLHHLYHHHDLLVGLLLLFTPKQ